MALSPIFIFERGYSKMKLYEDNNMFVGIMDTQIILAANMAKKKKQKREAKMYDIAFLICLISFCVCTLCCIISPLCLIPTWAILTFMAFDILFVYLAYQLKPKMFKFNLQMNKK